MDARQGIQSLETGIRIFQVLQRLGRPVALRELAAAVGLHPAKLHRYLVSLVRTGLVAQDAERRYGPAVQARQLASVALAELCRRIGETVFLSAWGRSGPVILQVEEPPRPVSVRPTTTGDLPLASSATGRVYAAFMPSERLRPLMEAELAPRKRAAYLCQLAEVRRRGLARSKGERYPGLNSFSAPIFGVDGGVVLALTVFGLASHFSGAWDSPAAKTLAAFASDLTRRIGGTPP